MEEIRLWPGGPLYTGAPVQADALLLADFAKGGAALRCAELGCGDGVGLLLLAAARPDARFTGIEINAAAAQRARENLRRNELSARGEVLTADYRALPLPRGAFELVLTNPPYFAQGRGAASDDPARDLARRESASFPELCAAAAALLREGGRFCLIQRPERLSELLGAMSAVRLEPKRLRSVHARAHAAPSLILLEGRLGGHTGLRWEPPLIIRGEDGRESAEYRRITHWEEET